jgi:hypothetical protein
MAADSDPWLFPPRSKESALSGRLGGSWGTMDDDQPVLRTVSPYFPTREADWRSGEGLLMPFEATRVMAQRFRFVAEWLGTR